MTDPSSPQDSAASLAPQAVIGSPGADSRGHVWLMACLPWILSLAFHALLIALAASVIYAIHTTGRQGALSLTSFDAGDDLEALRPDHQVLLPTEESALPTPQVEFDPSQADLAKLQADFPSPLRGDLSIVGIGGDSQSGLDGWRMVSGEGAGGPKADFFGQVGRGKRIIYVIDRSGSMLESFDFLRQELKRSIGRLNHNQRFHVILFNNDFVEMPPRKLVPAIGFSKRKCYAFLDQVRAGGMTDPIPAMEQAFRKKPDLIYFLTDGEFRPELVEMLRRWNRMERVKIFTLAYIYAPGSQLLKKIAEENGGTYTFVEGPWSR